MASHDPSALIEETVIRWAAVIRRAALRYGLLEDHFDELVQDVRLRIWRALESRGGDPATLAPSYGYQAAVSAAIDLLRSLRSRRRMSTATLEEAADSAALSRSHPAASESDLLDALERALLALPEDRRVAVRLHLSGQDLKEIVVLTGWSPARVRNLVYRGLGELRMALSRGEDTR